MKALGMILRIYSSLFSLFLGLFLTALAIVVIGTNATNLRMDMLPWWSSDSVRYWLLVCGLIGIAVALLSFMHKMRAFLMLFTLLAFVVTAYGFFINPRFYFSGADGAKSALWLVLAALLAFVGSLFHFTRTDKA